MAGDWIKFEVGTPEKPEVFAITANMGWSDPDLTVGKLLKVWRWFDQQTIDGNAPSVTPALLDCIAGVTGFANAMINVGWLLVSDLGLTLPNFGRHNGKTAKQRCQTAIRVANHKSNANTNADGNATSVSDALPREEKRRINTKEPSAPKFDPIAELKKRGVQDQTASDWLDLRKKKRCPLTATALSQIIEEADTAGMSLERALAISCRQGWAGFKASWLDGEKAKEPAKLPKREVVL